MIDCHMHLFTNKHLPEKVFYIPTDNSFMLFISKVLHNIIPWHHDPIENISELFNIFTLSTEELFNKYRNLVPNMTSCCPISLDFREFGDADYTQQLKELEELRQKYPKFIFPVLHINPNSPDCHDNFEKYIVTRKWIGIKLYSSLGYLPTDPRLKPMLFYCEKNNIPIWTHCSRIGIFNKLNDITNVSPENFIEVLKEYPRLKLNFCHFGGSVKKYTNLIDTLNVYADISFQQNHIKSLKYFLTTKNTKMMFGTDFPICMLSKEFPKSLDSIFNLFDMNVLDQNTKEFLTIS